MAHFFRGSGLGALLPTAAGAAFVARSLARRVAPAALVLRATAVPRPACGAVRQRWAVHVRVRERGREERGDGAGGRWGIDVECPPPLSQASSSAADAAADPPPPSVTAPFHLAIPVADLAAAKDFYGR